MGTESGSLRSQSTRAKRMVASIALITIVATAAALVPVAVNQPSTGRASNADASAILSTSGNSRFEGIPKLSHVFTIVLENESYSSTWGSGSPAHYLNSLRSQGELLTRYYGVGHSSTDNYIAMTSGQLPTELTTNDCVNYEECVRNVSSAAVAHGANIGTQLQGAGLSWKGYFGDMPSPCFHAATGSGPDPYQGDSTSPPARNYADRHNPFIYYRPIVGNKKLCDKHVVPYKQLASDLHDGSVPNYAFIVPNTCDDGHDSPCSTGQQGGLATADAWLKKNVPPIIKYVEGHNGLLVITFDEGDGSDTSGCCGSGPGGRNGFGGRVGLLAISPDVAKGKVNSTPYDHDSLLRTIEDAFRLPNHLNHAGSLKEHAMTAIFTSH